MKSNGKTIRQIADEIGVSKQAVQKRLSKEPLHTEIQPYINIINGANYIDAVGENIIKSEFTTCESATCDNQPANVADNQTTSGDNPAATRYGNQTTPDNQSANTGNQVYDLLKTTVDALQVRLIEQDKQMSVKDKQIEELNARLAEAHKMADQAQQLHGVDKALELNEQQLITDSTDKPTIKERLKYLFKGER